MTLQEKVKEVQSLAFEIRGLNIMGDALTITQNKASGLSSEYYEELSRQLKTNHLKPIILAGLISLIEENKAEIEEIEAKLIALFTPK